MPGMDARPGGGNDMWAPTGEARLEPICGGLRDRLGCWVGWDAVKLGLLPRSARSSLPFAVGSRD